ncbi:hypothetical protein GWK36_04820 [Caldichromatium japonicum]|uniref:Uncharacterized protein n=1 Tax=Caldichromatium japonicum TaxID=2699430 RepID=A0A6G7VC15_9GAMM|nr:hypothetical protein [Caldichromatium japonicum]QIK37416.1 hypothetical protein GWK36_04820 [Caldichromatium japonicum]
MALTIPWLLSEAASLDERILQNETPHIVSQCYTKMVDAQGRVHNPCYTCHTRSEPPNYINDQDLQLAFSFPAPAEENPWKNLYKDRRAAMAAISDAEMRAYLRQSNYLDAEGRIIPAQRLAKPPADWDYNDNGRWEGFIPDAYFRFDEEGFDLDPEGRPTGWRAFAYYPFPGTFWPTNGSTDDVLIRLAEPFRRALNGEFDRTVYKTNLAIVESLIRRRDIPIEPVDEAALGRVDLDRDGAIGTAQWVRYDWAPREGRLMWYVGQALEEQRAGRLHLAAGLYPEGTEFLHTVRYIDVDERGDNKLSARMKEVRHAIKRYWMSYADLDLRQAAEFKERHDFPDRVRAFRGNLESGLSNDQGWVYSGLIEDAEGQLRPQSYEELAFCIGCHGGIGATTDSSFAFPRRLGADHFQRGWFHWSQKGLEGLPEPLRRDGEPEYAFYLKVNGAGDEFRHNREVMARFFDAKGELKPQMLKRLREDISLLLYASPERAMQLNKAYRVIVKEQSFIEGRDAMIETAGFDVHPWVDRYTPTGIKEPLLGY